MLGPVSYELQASDARDYVRMRATMTSVEAVVLATAPTREDPAAYLVATESVLRAAIDSKVSRLVAVSNYKALLAPDGRRMLDAEPPHPYFHDLESIYAAQADIFRRHDEIDWLLISPPAELFPYGRVTGEYRIAENVLVTNDPDSSAFKEVSRLSMEDFSSFVADEIERPQHHRALITAAY